MSGLENTPVAHWLTSAEQLEHIAQGQIKDPSPFKVVLCLTATHMWHVYGLT